jgi:hypothetical protein
MRGLRDYAAAQAPMIGRPNDKVWIVNAAGTVAVYAPHELGVLIARQRKVETVDGIKSAR